MTPDRLGELWHETLKNKALLGRVIEDTIERFYSRWVQPGDLVIDVGANVGRHTRPLAAAVGPDGRVLAFEAAPITFSNLRDSLEQWPVKDRVQLHHAAVGDRVGTAEFDFVIDEPALSSLKLRDSVYKARTDIQRVTVPLTTLDTNCMTENVRFVKIDVEGAEFSVFQGAQKIMKYSHPVFAFEDGRMGSSFTFGYDMKEFYTFFERRDYVVLDTFGLAVDERMDCYNGPWSFFASSRLDQANVSELILLSAISSIFANVTASS